ncbi:DegT/DnrJ/EryC1/StrS family aminotransferase [Streptomyces sp. SCA3-4]|uniref:DegT/DnrJ/EryC1/StrS family aminotransferase n=1 Tax=Streptomyces sichuanensis TaxID=2871810 RepID=UPI001CE255FB|nr:DegT/DnrJ/EryC1/StrS family aminotransferase [Streptomyces sichuanensis]MCA6096479.1 DegT/DnrJ/EryC1/StrS family aminotransferase [Streptomyces sichuanensis]
MRTAELLSTAHVGAGDEVVVPSYATAATAEAVRDTGALPVFADIAPQSLCLDPASVSRAITARTVAVAAVPLFGHPVDLAALQRAAGRTVLVLAPTDPTDGAEEGEGEEGVARRRANAAYLDARLTGVTPVTAPGILHRYHSYVVRVPGNGRPDRDAFARALLDRGVRCRVPVQTPVHRLPSFRRELWLPETERAAGECLALPVDAGTSRRELQRLVAACNALGGLLPAAAA